MATTPPATHAGYTPLLQRGKKYLITRGIGVFLLLVAAIVASVIVGSFLLWLALMLFIIGWVLLVIKPFQWCTKLQSKWWRIGLWVVCPALIILVVWFNIDHKIDEYHAKTPQLTQAQATAVNEVAAMLIDYRFENVNTDQIKIDASRPDQGTYTGDVIVDGSAVTVTLDVVKQNGEWYVGCVRNGALVAFPKDPNDTARAATLKDVLNNGGKCRH